jgi:flavoprotein
MLLKAFGLCTLRGSLGRGGLDLSALYGDGLDVLGGEPAPPAEPRVLWVDGDAHDSILDAMEVKGLRTGEALLRPPATSNAMKSRLLWAVTGAGHLLDESLAAVEGLAASGVEVRPVLSSQGEAVARAYGLAERIRSGAFRPAVVERSPNHPSLLGALYRGELGAVLVAPASANTTAKLALGIADALVPNLAAQAMKCGVPVLVLPTDLAPGAVETALPGGRRGTLGMRAVDVANARRLGRMPGVRVLASPAQIPAAVAEALASGGRRAHLNIE